MRDNSGVLDSYHLGEVLAASARKLGERCGNDAVATLARRLVEYIGPMEEDRYSYIWRPAIEDHEQNAHREDMRAVLVDGLRDAAMGATTIDSALSVSVANSLLRSPYATLVRVGIHVCSEHYGTVGSAFWENVQKRWFVDPVYWHEIYWLIKKNYSKFSAAQRRQFLEIVTKGMDACAEDKEKDELSDTYRRDLLHPAFGLGDQVVDAKYAVLVERWGAVRDHPDFHSYSTGGWIGDRSPIASDALIAMSDEELVTYLKSFAPQPRSWDGPTYRGLATSISAAVRASEDGFASRIPLFSELARPYQHGLIRGLKERWYDDKREINWLSTLQLIEGIVSSPAFEDDLFAKLADGWEPTVYWVVNDIADLLRSVSATERKLPEQHRQASLRILQRILAVTRPSEAGDSEDAVSHAINSSRGRTLESFIHLALAMRRAEVAANPESNGTWTAVGPVFDSELATSESGLNADFAALAGTYCPNFHFLNSEWTETNFNRIFSLTDDAAWRCAAQGFAYQNRLYDWLYRLLVQGGHLERMILSEGLPGRVADRALQFLGLAYLEGIERLDGDGILARLVAGLNVKELSQICWFFWSIRDRSNNATRTAKILEFWMRVATQIRTSGSQLPELQSALCQLTAYVTELAPNIMEALIDAAPHAQVSHHGYMLIENLSRLALHFPKEVVEIFRAAMTGFLPDYRQADVVNCVSRLADQGEIESAMQICNDYAVRGSNLLKETYEGIRARQRSLGDSGAASAELTDP